MKRKFISVVIASLILFSTLFPMSSIVSANTNSGSPYIISRYKTVTSPFGTGASALTDGTDQNWWSGKFSGTPVWAVIDLGSEESINGFRVMFPRSSWNVDDAWAYTPSGIKVFTTNDSTILDPNTTSDQITSKCTEQYNLNTTQGYAFTDRSELDLLAWPMPTGINWDNNGDFINSTYDAIDANHGFKNQTYDNYEPFNGNVSARYVVYEITGSNGGSFASNQFEVVASTSAASPVKSIQLNRTSATLKAGDTMQLIAYADPYFANVVFESLDSSVATVDSSGLVIAAGEGKATIIAKSEDGLTRATCTITVTPAITRNISATDRRYFFGISPAPINSASDMQTYVNMGVKSMRVNMQYNNFTNPDGSYNWSYYDNIADLAAQNDIEITMLICIEAVNDGLTAGDPTYNNDYVNRVLDIIKHYKNHGVTSFEIWNEENWPGNPGESSYYPVDSYAQVLHDIAYASKVSYNGGAALDPDAKIVFGGMDAMASGVANGVRQDTVDYLNNFFKSSAYQDWINNQNVPMFDALAYHNYMTVDVDHHLQTDSQSNFFNSSLQPILGSLDANGYTSTPLWLTEIGDNDVNNYLQAAKMRTYMTTAYNNPRVDRLDWFTFYYPGSDAGSRFSIDGREAQDEYARVASQLSGTATRPVTGISLAQTTLNLPLLATMQMIPLITPLNAAPATITWTSSNSAVASVDNTGFVTAKSAGTTIITATVNGVLATCTVTVNLNENVSVVPGSMTEMSYLVSAGTTTYNPSYMTGEPLTPPPATANFRFADKTAQFVYKFNLNTTDAGGTLSVFVGGKNYDFFISADGQQWTELGKRVWNNPPTVPSIVTGMSSVRPAVIDLHDYIPQGAVYIKMCDSDPTQGNGGVIWWVKLRTTHVVSFNLNGGPGTAPAPIMVSDTESYGALPTPVRAGFVFFGWYNAAIGGNHVTSSTIFSNAADQSLYAHWVPILKIDGDAKGGAGSKVNVTLESPSLHAVIQNDGVQHLELIVGGKRLKLEAKKNASNPGTLPLYGSVTVDLSAYAKAGDNSILVDATGPKGGTATVSLQP